MKIFVVKRLTTKGEKEKEEKFISVVVVISQSHGLRLFNCITHGEVNFHCVAKFSSFSQFLNSSSYGDKFIYFFLILCDCIQMK